MPKDIKGHAWRKPPDPSANHSDIEEWFRPGLELPEGSQA
jgi:hypothetical protein